MATVIFPGTILPKILVTSADFFKGGIMKILKADAWGFNNTIKWHQIIYFPHLQLWFLLVDSLAKKFKRWFPLCFHGNIFLTKLSENGKNLR